MVEFVSALSNDDPGRLTVTIYASSSGAIPGAYKEAAWELGNRVAKEGWRQVNGGGLTGLMGAATEGGVAARGIVDAVILDIFADKNMHSSLRNVVVEKTMTERKRGLFEAGDAFIALPGGLGTMEEIMEVMSWRQLNFHQKPIVLMNTDGFYSPVVEFLEKSMTLGFISKEFRNTFHCCNTADEAVSFLKSYRGYEINKAAIFAGNMAVSDWSAAAQR